jgi:lysophospholipid acyltransferase (LPLAT)-like uncharacterized protein
MSFGDFILATKSARHVVAVAAAEYLRFVKLTCSCSIDPPDFYEKIDAPCILAMWHGQHFMVPFFRREPFRAKVLISRHRDGDINAMVAERLGVGTIRGSGTLGRDIHKKGGASGFKTMLSTLAEGYSVALTADVPKLSRVAGRGIVRLARAAQRPIYPIAPATSRRFELNNWDHTAVNLPFGRIAFVVGDPICVEASADDAALERARLAVQAGLDAATSRAYAIVDRKL